MYPNGHFGQPILNELMNQALSFLECKRNFNREKFQKKVWICSCGLCIVLCNWSLSLSSSKEIEEKDTLGQNPFDINIRTIIVYHQS